MTLELVIAAAMAAGIGGTPRSWTPVERALSPRTADANPGTYELLRVATEQDPVDFGIEWNKPQRIGEVAFGFASLGGRSYEPSAAASHLEARVGGSWRPVPAELTLDYSGQGSLAPLQGRGTVWWTYRFVPTEIGAVRLRADAPGHTDPGYQCIALAEMRAAAGGSMAMFGHTRALGQPPRPPGWLEPGANLADPESGAKVSRGAATVIRWPKPLMMSCVRTSLGAKDLRIEILAGQEWRQVEALPQTEPGVFRFVPVATAGLRVHTAGPCTVHLDEAGRRYFEQVRASRNDLLGERFRHAQSQDLAEMQSFLLPTDFAKVAVGRPADLHETMAMWTGTFLMVENSEGLDPQTGAKLPAQDIDRWFAPAATHGRFGSDWMDTHSHYLGWMPAVVTEYEEDGLTYSQTLFVTAPDRSDYGNVAIVEVRNPTSLARNARFEYAMGRRPQFGDPWTPFSQDPLPTRYALDPDRRTVRNGRGEIILEALEPGRWGGTPRENHLAYAFKLKPGEFKRLAFFMPSVDAPLSKPPKIDPDGELREFRAWWTNLFRGAAKVDVPEAPINDLYKNLITQSLIITLDGDQVRYGAYQYESYFGVEEGWPAVALAQYGFGETAKRISGLMLSPQLMDKANYHHQYRNGLDPWYAITIARLTGDMDWLRKQMPMIQSCADWTIQVTGANKDPKYGGTLPKHVYGGDVGMPAYSLYSNATCWRGLHDAAVAMELLGNATAASRYREAAETYRKRIVSLADQLVETSGGLPFLPMSFDLDTPSGHRDKEPAYPFLASHTTSADTWGYVGNYWNLLAPLLLEVRLFDPTDKREAWIPNYIERRGGLLTGLARFDLGLDHIYGKGYIESLLEQGRREEFVTSFYGLLTNGISRNLFSSPEVSGIFPLRIDNLALYREHDRERWNWFYRGIGQWLAGWQNQEGEPLSAGAGMALQVLRMALVREDDAADPPVGLRLLDGAPAVWFGRGRHVAVKDMRTFFGKVSFRVDSHGNTYSASLNLPAVPCILRLPHPGGLVLTGVTINGRPWHGFAGNEITLKGLPAGVHLEAHFGPADR
ncbi:MAG: hypothetical protein ACHQ50_00585 [Fimbriimonadales bacterium]